MHYDSSRLHQTEFSNADGRHKRVVARVTQQELTSTPRATAAVEEDANENRRNEMVGSFRETRHKRQHTCTQNTPSTPPVLSLAQRATEKL